MGTNGFDVDSEMESAILDRLGADGLVLWRQDLPWHQGMEPVERHVVGFWPCPEGPRLCMASARPAWGRVSVAMHLDAAVADVCRPAAPGGDVQAVDLRVQGIFDNAVILETMEMGSALYVSRALSHASAVYVLRIKPDDGGPERLAVVTSRKDVGDAYATGKVCVDMAFEEVLAMAGQAFEAQRISPPKT